MTDGTEMTPAWCTRVWAVVGLAMVFSWMPGGTAANGLDDAVDKLVAGLAVDSCPTRMEAVRKYPMPSDEGVRQQAALRGRAKVLSGDMRARVLAIADVMDDRQKGYARMLDLMRRAAKVIDAPGDKQKQGVALSRLRKQLVGVIHDPKERISARVNVPFVIARSSEYAAQFTSDWGQELPPLLRSGDPMLRLVGAVTAVAGRLPKGNDPSKDLVIGILIEGLSSDDVAARYLSQQILFDATGIRIERLCFDPTDSQEARAAGIQRWAEWLTEKRGELSRETIPQRFW